MKRSTFIDTATKGKCEQIRHQIEVCETAGSVLRAVPNYQVEPVSIYVEDCLGPFPMQFKAIAIIDPWTRMIMGFRVLPAETIAANAINGKRYARKPGCQSSDAED